MKKVINFMMLLIVLYFGAQALYNFFLGRDEATYQINKENGNYQVVEKYGVVEQEKESINSYYYEITKDNILFNFRITNSSFLGVKAYLNDLKTYEENGISCIYPIFKDDKVHTDVYCNMDNIQYEYGLLKGKYAGLDNFVNELKTLGYSHNAWQTSVSVKTTGNLKYFNENQFANHYLAVWNFKGIYIVGQNREDVHVLLGTNELNNTLGARVNNYYVFPNYLVGPQFDTLLITQVQTGRDYQFPLNQKIADNSYIQGSVDGNLYLMDKINKIQYKFNILNRTVEIVGSTNITGVLYRNGLWTSKSVDEMIALNMVFGDDEPVVEGLDMTGITNVDNIYGKGGYYYLWSTTGSNTKLYRVDKENISKRTLLLDLPNVSDIQYVGSSVFLISNEYIYGYHENYGLKQLVQYDSLKVNKINRYEVYNY